MPALFLASPTGRGRRTAAGDVVVRARAVVRKMKAAAIIFAREPVAGRAKTRLIPILGAGNAAALADAFIRDACRKARALRPARLVIAADAPDRADGSRYFHALARKFGARLVDQGPGNLGDRMARVLRIHAGPDGAILFGTDTPSLPAALLKRSAELLQRAPVVLAPALDGGYYLVGMRDRLPGIFSGIRWGSARVLGETLTRLRAVGEPYALGPWWYDVDRPGDLLILARHLGGRAGAAPVLATPLGRASAAWARAMPLGRTMPCPATAALLAELGLFSRGSCRVPEPSRRPARQVVR